MIVVKSSSKSWCYCWNYEGIGDIVLSYIWSGSCRPMDKSHFQMWIWFTWLGMWHRGSVVLQVAPQPREPSDGFCGLKLAEWETCNSYYLSLSPGHILGTKKSAWLNGSHLMLSSWSQANVSMGSPLSHLYPLLNPLLSINCLEVAQPRAIVASLLSGLVDNSWELPCHLGCFGHCLGAFDPFLLLEAFFLNWGTPHSLEFPPFCACPFSLSGSHSSTLYLYPGNSPSSASGLCSSWTIPSMGLASNGLGITDSQTEGGLSEMMGDAPAITNIHCHTGPFWGWWFLSCICVCM